MKRIAECDEDALYISLDSIGVNVEDLDMTTISVEYLQELYRYLLRMQLVAWKAGKNCHQLIRDTNRALREDRVIFKSGVLFR